MKKFLVSMFSLLLIASSANAATWVASDRVAPVGAKILEKNNLPKGVTFKVVKGDADNSNATTTNVIFISSDDLAYAGNDNEVAAVVGNELGHIINGQTSKTKLRNMAKTAITSSLSSENIISTAANSQYLASKSSLNDNKAADVTGTDLMVKAGYNPLAMVVLVTKMPGSTLEAVQGKPSNSERAMFTYDYLTYNYPQKVKAGYNCKEYRYFLTYANPIVKDRNSKPKKLAKFNKLQEKNKKLRAKNLAQFQTTGANSWDYSYELIKAFTETK
ncbi:MAG: M48 family metalloprotease [bacterium]|nr:M48 family metalloprotease [bacterium]